MKRCSNCKETKSFESYSKNKVKKDGYQNVCKACKRGFDARWWAVNKDLRCAYEAKRNAIKTQRMLLWGKEQHKQEIENWYRRAQIASIFMGEKYHVDHIEPLQGKDRSGLHVPWNLQLLTATENMKKGNRVKT